MEYKVGVKMHHLISLITEYFLMVITHTVGSSDTGGIMFADSTLDELLSIQIMFTVNVEPLASFAYSSAPH